MHTAMEKTNCGVLRFQDLARFEASGPLSQVDQAMELLSSLSKTPLKVSPIVDWPRITQCIRRGTLFALTAQSPGLTAHLRFDPADPDTGDYEIHVPLERRNEAGRVVSVIALEQDALYEYKYAALAKFALRYLLITSAADRQGTQQVWLVGISQYRDIDPTELEDNIPSHDV